MNLRYWMVMVLSALIRLVTGASARWLVPPSAGQHVYYANHSSNLDAIVLWAALPPAARLLTRPVAARDYWEKNKLRRWLATRVFNAILIERATHLGEAGSARDVLAAFNTMVGAIGRDHSIIIFPEGMRSDEETLRPFKAGIYHIAKRRPDLEFVPVYIENLNRILPKHEIVPIPLLGGLTFGPPVRMEEGETKQSFLDRAREALIALKDPTC